MSTSSPTDDHLKGGWLFKTNMSMSLPCPEFICNSPGPRPCFEGLLAWALAAPQAHHSASSLPLSAPTHRLLFGPFLWLLTLHPALNTCSLFPFLSEAVKSWLPGFESWLCHFLAFSSKILGKFWPQCLNFLTCETQRLAVPISQGCLGVERDESLHGA